MNQEHISVCGHSFETGIDYFSLPWELSEIPDMSELAKLNQFPKLTAVSLNNTDLNDYGLKFVCQCPQIDNLNLQDTNISKIGIAYLVRLKKLLYLRLKENWQLENNCVPFLNRLEALQDLQIHETNIDHKGIAQLELPNLQNLLINDAPSEILAALSRRMPECNVLVKGKAEYLNGKLLWEK